MRFHAGWSDNLKDSVLDLGLISSSGKSFCFSQHSRSAVSDFNWRRSSHGYVLYGAFDCEQKVSYGWFIKHTWSNHVLDSYWLSLWSDNEPSSGLTTSQTLPLFRSFTSCWTKEKLSLNAEFSSFFNARTGKNPLKHFGTAGNWTQAFGIMAKFVRRWERCQSQLWLREITIGRLKEAPTSK